QFAIFFSEIAKPKHHRRFSIYTNSFTIFCQLVGRSEDSQRCADLIDRPRSTVQYDPRFNRHH
ncbi:MAG: hypothetical protein VXZ53_04135, partial [Planctomycetota bacterium]|nr:hypothetical protein [Planctomycetota bacterium]